MCPHQFLVSVGCKTRNVSNGHTSHIVSSFQTELVDNVLNVLAPTIYRHSIMKLLAFHLQTLVHFL